MISAFAETNRVPFDLPEAENELVAGFHTEYSSMKFACFFMSEYANMVTITCVATLLFLGGWHPLFPAPYSNYIRRCFLLAALCSFTRSSECAEMAIGLLLHHAFGIGAIFILAVLFAIPHCSTILVPVFWFASQGRDFYCSSSFGFAAHCRGSDTTSSCTSPGHSCSRSHC